MKGRKKADSRKDGFIKNMKSLYDILGIKKNSSKEEIKKAYNDMAKTERPDKGGSTEKMAEINKAYMVLSNPSRRQRYNETGQESEKPFDAKFTGFVNNIFFQIVSATEDVDHIDLIEAFKEGVQQIVSNIKKSKKQTEKDLNKFERIKKRLRYKNDVTILNIVEAQIDGLTKSIKASEEELLFIYKCETILDEYGYEVDPWPEDHQQVKFGNMTFNVGGM